jgi:hypothetical protein
VSDRCCHRGDGRDPDVRTRTCRGARGDENDDGQPNVAEDQADEPADDSGEETPTGDGDEEEGVQSLEYRAWPSECGV